MHFKEFITRQRVIIVIVGIATFVIALFFSHLIGFSTLGGALFVNLAASSITIVFTALIIDYLGLKEASDKDVYKRQAGGFHARPYGVGSGGRHVDAHGIRTIGCCRRGTGVGRADSGGSLA